MLCLFGHQRECGEQLHEYLDNHLIHGFRRRDLGVDIESIEEVSNGLEKIAQGTVVVYGALDRLTRLNVTRMRLQRVNTGTYGDEYTEASLYCFHGREML